MTPTASQEQALDRSPAACQFGQRPHREQLIKSVFPVTKVAAGQPKFPFQVNRSEQFRVDQVSVKTGDKVSQA